MSDSPEPSDQRSSACFEKAVELLARRPHFRRQLEQKLVQRGFTGNEIEAACRRLSEHGYLDDLACARSLARGQLLRKGYGPRRLRAELERRGAGEGVVAVVVGESFEDGETPLARRAAEMWLRRNPWDRGRLARHLDRRGYSRGVILSVLEERSGEAGETPPNGSD